MERYNRIHQDPKSPLTPLTPLSRHSAFPFNMPGDGSLRDYINNIEFTPPSVAQPAKKLATKPAHFSKDFQKIRQVFEKPRVQITPANVQPHANSNEQQIHHRHQEHDKAKLHRKPGATSTLVAKKAQDAVLLSVPGQQMHHQHSPATPKRGDQSPLPGSKQQQQASQDSHYRRASPIESKPLSPRISDLLIKAGITQFKALFQREEIDMEVFRMLTSSELDVLGVTRPENRQKIMKAIKFARDFF